MAKTTHAISFTISFQWTDAHRDLHSFPTRRSSDLDPAPAGRRRHANSRFRRDRPASCRAARTCPPASSGSGGRAAARRPTRSEEHTSELHAHVNHVCRLLLEKKKKLYVTSMSRKYG